MVKLVDVAARAREMRNVREEKRGRGRVGYRGCRGPQRVGGALAALLSLLPFPVSLFFSRSFSPLPLLHWFLVSNVGVVPICHQHGLVHLEPS